MNMRAYREFRENYETEPQPFVPEGEYASHGDDTGRK